MASNIPKRLIGRRPSGNAGSITGHHKGNGVYHTAMPSGNQGSIIHSTPDTTAKNFSTGLPKVSGGMPPHPTHINNLSAAVDKNTVRSFTGGLVKQANGGTTIESRPIVNDHPFKVSVVGERIQMKAGLVFSYGSSTCSIKQYYPSSDLDIGIPRGGEFVLPENSKSAFTANTTVTSSGDKDAYVFNFPAGDLTNGRLIWMDCGSSPPVLRNTLQGEFNAGSGIPIAFVKQGGLVIQLVDGDLMARQSLGLQASVTESVEGTTKKYYLRVTAGHINNVIPTLGGLAISDSTAKLQVTESCEVWLKCNRSSPPAHFPTSIPIELGTLGVMKNDTDSAGYLLLATVTFTPSGTIGSVVNYLGGSLWGEAHKFNPSTATYYFYRI